MIDFIKDFMFVIFALSFFSAVFCAAPYSSNQKTVTQALSIQKLQEHVVSIKIRAPISAYSQEGAASGSGCIVDSSGIVVTNAHVVGCDSVASYEVTLFDGREIEAKLLYVDPWLDIAFLKISNENLPPISKIQTKEVAVGDPVIVVGKNEGMNFSTQTGTIANPYETVTPLPSQVFRISLNAQGGASGSPVFNSSGEMVGLVLASDMATSAFAYPVCYINDILEFIKSGKKPNRFGLGVILEYVSCDGLTRYYGMPKETSKSYREKFPQAFNRMLIVKQILRGSPADGKFEPGDVILRVNGNEIGPFIYLFDKAINDSQGDVTVDIQRKNNKITIKIPPYNLFKNQIKRMVLFGGAVFYEADDHISRRTGVNGHPVFITNIRPGSSFFEKLPVLPQARATLVEVLKMGDFDIKNLDDLIKAIPSLVKRKDFYIEFRNYGVEIGFGQALVFNQNQQTQGVSYMRQDGLPEVYCWNEREQKYDVEIINID